MIIQEYSKIMKDGKTYRFKSVDLSEAAMMYELRLKTAAETDFLLRYPEEYPETHNKEAESVANAMNSNRDFLLGVFDGESLVGSAHVFPVSAYRKFAHRCGIGVLLARAYWSCGIGKTLMTDSMELAREMGYTIMQLETFTQNERALGMYEHLGFRKVGIIPAGAVLKDGRCFDEIMMYKDL